MPRVLIVDDHVIVRRGLHGVVSAQPGWECCGEAESGEAALDSVAMLKPDVVVMDVSMPGMGGIKATEALRKRFPHTKVVLLTLHKSTELLRAGLAAGATGYVLKSDEEEELLVAVEAVTRGEVYVTKAMDAEAASRIMREVAASATPAAASATANAGTPQV